MLRFFLPLVLTKVIRYLVTWERVRFTASRQCASVLWQVLVIQKLCDLFMRQPGHFLFGNGELTHIFKLVGAVHSPCQFAKYSAQIALFQIERDRAGTFLPFLAKLDFTGQACVTIMSEQFRAEISGETVSEGIEHQDQLVINMLASGQRFAVQFKPKFHDVFLSAKVY